jgi:hypothetical protein
MEETIERRKEKRFRCKEGCFAMLWPAASKAGIVLDISSGGLAFRYMARSKPEEFPSELESEIEIICSQDDFSSGLLPVEHVSDIKMERTFSYLIPWQLRRHSVKFKLLSEEQKFQLERSLERFIENYCTDNAKS